MHAIFNVFSGIRTTSRNFKVFIQGVFLVLSKVILLKKGHLLPKMFKGGSHLFSLERPFQDLVLKKIYNLSVIIHLLRFWRLIIVKICRIH